MWHSQTFLAGLSETVWIDSDRRAGSWAGSWEPEDQTAPTRRRTHSQVSGYAHPTSPATKISLPASPGVDDEAAGLLGPNVRAGTQHSAAGTSKPSRIRRSRSELLSARSEGRLGTVPDERPLFLSIHDQDEGDAKGGRSRSECIHEHLFGFADFQKKVSRNLYSVRLSGIVDIDVPNGGTTQ